MAYDEVGQSVKHYRRFAIQATRELLGKPKADVFIPQIKQAKSQAEISRIMTSVRRAI